MKNICKKIGMIALFFMLAFAASTVCTAQRTEAATMNGLVKIDGKRYYYIDGVKQYKWVTITSNDGTVSKYYFDPANDGAAVSGKKTIGKYTYCFGPISNKLYTNRYGIKVGSYYYRIDKYGRMTKVSTVEGLAGIKLDECGGSYRTAFTWCAQITYVSMDVSGMKISDLARYGFTNNRGDCNVQAACLYWLARVRGYNTDRVKYCKGYVTNKKMTTFSKHAWITIDGKVYDANFCAYVMRPLNGGKTLSEAVKLAYGFYYGASGHFVYCNSSKVALG